MLLHPRVCNVLNDMLAVSKDIDMEADSKLTRMLQAVAVPILGNVCHVFMHGLNRVQVSGCCVLVFFNSSLLKLFHCTLRTSSTLSQIYGAEKLHQLVLHRPENKPLITVCVLISCLSILLLLINYAL